MYLRDKTQYEYTFYVGEDATINFRSQINATQYEFLNDYTLEVWASGNPLDYSPEFQFTSTINTGDPTLGVINIPATQTENTRSQLIYIRVYGTNKITNQIKMLYGTTVQLLA